MNTILVLQQYQVNKLYSSLFMYKQKEKNHMVLEPLQAMIQLALLSVCKVGTKLTIQENTLFIQPPSLIQPFNRWYNVDKKDDLYFLFPVIKKFIKWYNPNNKKSAVTKELYELLIKMSIKGLHHLIKTYQFCNNITVIQVINMYIELLTNNEVDDKILENNIKKPEEGNNDINIDEIFEKIITIYKPTLLNIINNILMLLEEEDNNESITNYIIGLNSIMKKNNKNIQDWIQTKLIIS
jgi:hypothetical protein